jgi:hypothetical protein
VRSLALEERQSLATVGGAESRDSVIPEHGTDEIQKIRVVVDHEYGVAFHLRLGA